MAYTITDVGALNVLTVLRGVSKEADTVQRQVSSELRVETAADNASSWASATTLRSDENALRTVGDALGLGAAKVDTAYTAITSLIDVVSEIRKTVVSASDPANDRDKLSVTMEQYKAQLESAVNSVNFSGENWLLNRDATAPVQRSVIGGFVRGPNGEYYPQNITYPAANTIMIDTNNASRGLLTKSINADPDAMPARNYYLLDAGSTTSAVGSEMSISTSSTSQDLQDMLTVLDNIISSLNATAAGLGTMNSRIEDRQDFVATLSTSLKRSIGALVDTDMDEASVRLSAAQTARDMATEALSVMNTSASKVLILLE
ncbi:flagellin C 4 [Rhizobium etli 8C-3]|uniref:Flagellin n=1 Tax=Rhizobium etli 8C-3 TaxID=538025 RepID=A0A1L5P078_RHIET|nr:flagellin [Rhizobium etli]APO73560.1 flagellin C 4 [Rhizobium etli 8C-3]